MATWRRTEGPQCRAWARIPHPATHRTGYCDKHHKEYQAAMQRYRNAVYNFTHGRTTKEPPEKADFVKRIRFTKPGPDVATVLTPREKEALMSALADLSSVPVLLERLAEKGEAPATLYPRTWQAKIGEAQSAVNRAMMLIARVAGAD